MAHSVITGGCVSAEQEGRRTALDEEETDDEWMRFLMEQWHEELSDTREDIYTLEDGLPLDTPR